MKLQEPMMKKRRFNASQEDLELSARTLAREIRHLKFDVDLSLRGELEELERRLHRVEKFLPAEVRAEIASLQEASPNPLPDDPLPDDRDFPF
jgi:hypothetical protein